MGRNRIAHTAASLMLSALFSGKFDLLISCEAGGLAPRSDSAVHSWSQLF